MKQEQRDYVTSDIRSRQRYENKSRQTNKHYFHPQNCKISFSFMSNPLDLKIYLRILSTYIEYSCLSNPKIPKEIVRSHSYLFVNCANRSFTRTDIHKHVTNNTNIKVYTLVLNYGQFVKKAITPYMSKISNFRTDQEKQKTIGTRRINGPNF